MRLKRLTGIILSLGLVIGSVTVVPAATPEAKTGQFTIASMNVDGMPNQISVNSIYNYDLNKDGPGSEGSKKISQKMSQYGWDLIALSEDFNYHSEIMGSLSAYQSGTSRGGIATNWNIFNLPKWPLDTDGLNLLWKKTTVSTQGEKFISWNQKYGTDINVVVAKIPAGNGADNMIDKGFRFYQATIKNDITVDVYSLHMDADSSDGDIAARESEITQLVNMIKASDNKNPIIIMGDTNCRYTRERMENLLINSLNADSRFTVMDPWVEYVRDGVYPTYGAEAIVAQDKGGSFPYPQAEIVDKIFVINNTDSEVTLKAENYTVATDFVGTDGSALADHWPIVVDITYSIGDVEEPHVHSFTETINKEASCTEKGEKTFSCECGETYKESVDALEHDYQVSEKTDSNCVTGGSTVYTCTRCGDFYSETSTPTGHSYQEIVTEPTCTEAGYTTHICEYCNDSYTDQQTDALGHDYQVTSTTVSDCTVAGTTIFTCSRCGDSYTEESSVPGHIYEEDTVLPTCTEQGYTTYTCAICQDQYVDFYVPAKGHSFDAGNCTVCGEKDPDYQPPAIGDSTIGSPVTEIISGSKYALIFNSEIPYVLEHNSDGTIGVSEKKCVEGTSVSENQIWTITEATGGYTISTEINGKTKYLARTKTLVNGGYKVALQNASFIWTMKSDASMNSIRFTTKIVGKDYYLRYYTEKTGWIAATKAAGIKVCKVVQ